MQQRILFDARLCFQKSSWACGRTFRPAFYCIPSLVPVPASPPPPPPPAPRRQHCTCYNNTAYFEEKRPTNYAIFFFFVNLPSVLASICIQNTVPVFHQCRLPRQSYAYSICSWSRSGHSLIYSLSKFQWVLSEFRFWQPTAPLTEKNIFVHRNFGELPRPVLRDRGTLMRSHPHGWGYTHDRRADKYLTAGANYFKIMQLFSPETEFTPLILASKAEVS